MFHIIYIKTFYLKMKITEDKLTSPKMSKYLHLSYVIHILKKH